jgi:putative spermidine/putrescine transport system permease protein
LFGGLGGVDQNLESAAWTLGASRLRAFWKVTAGAAMPSIVGAWLISFLISWDEIVVALFQTGFHKTLPVVIYSYLQSGLQPTVAAVAAMLICLTLVTSGAFALVSHAQSRRSRGKPAFNP